MLTTNYYTNSLNDKQHTMDTNKCYDNTLMGKVPPPHTQELLGRISRGTGP